MLLIAGTVPLADLPLVWGKVEARKETFVVNNHTLPCTQGTTAMVNSALAVTNYLNLEAPEVLLAGDIGTGVGSRQIYQYLIEKITELNPSVLALHYWMPDLDLMKKLCVAVNKCKNRPIMIADAASMYAAKAVGLASEFDIFTPDATEIAFLADPEAVHPAYINRHLFETDISKAPELIVEAYKHKGAAKLLLVKGPIDYIAEEKGILATIDQPDVPELECIGGTGDTITGMVAAFTFAGLEPYQAAIISAKANRVAGQLIQANPGTRVEELIQQLPGVFKSNLCTWSGVCFTEVSSEHDRS
jgi:NAD(P)H-hydrate repair Nnr-like enzyme with NAD(P)H-hydrate dehydratase domain